MTFKNMTFWGATGLFGFAMGASGLMYLSQNPAILEGFVQLGYPVYLILFLGIAKLLGSVALVFRRWPGITEWAYAGFTFNLLGASYSHALNGDPIGKVIPPLVLLGVLAVSYGLGKGQQPDDGPVRQSTGGRPLSQAV